MKPRGHKRTELGFTMIEVMIALLLTAIATSGLIGMFMIETRASGFSRHSTEATILAQDKIEKLRTDMTAVSSSETGIDEKGKTTGIFNRTWDITDGSPFDTIVVTVDWVEDGLGRSVILRSARND